MSHIIFGSFDTTGKFIIAPYEIPMPKVQTNYVSIPGRNGMLDLSESYGSVKYRDRRILISQEPTLTAIAEMNSKGLMPLSSVSCAVIWILMSES